MFTQGVQSLYESNADKITREKCRAREDYISLEQAIAQSKESNAVLEHALDEATAQLKEYKRRFGAL